MKFNVKKIEDAFYTGKYHIQDHDNKFQFYGIFKSVKPDELIFYICGKPVGSVIRGTYSFPVGSNFTLHQLRLDVDKKEWIYTQNIIGWKDITETDENDNVKEETDMTEWLPCVVSDGTLRVNTSVNEGDKIYRIFNDVFDIKADMTIKSLGWSKISLHLMDLDVDISNIEVDESLRVCQTSSENDPGILVVKRDLEYNKELKPGCLYRVIDSELNFRYLMYIKRFNDTYIDAAIIKFAIFETYSNVKTEHRQLSLIDLEDKMFAQVSLGKGCNFKLE